MTSTAGPAVLLVVMFTVPAPPGHTAEAIVAGVYRRQAALAQSVADGQYRAEYRYEERNPDSTIRALETCTRRVSVRGERRHVEFLEVTANGRVLEGRDRERKLRELRGKGLVQDWTRMPFLLETRDEYSYELAGTDSAAGRPAWIVGFKPVRRDGRHIVGRAWVLSDSGHDVARLEFRPDRLPFVVPQMKMVLHYAPTAGMMLPVFFELDMRVHVRLILTLADRYIRIEDRFSEYRFNTGLPDSLFE